MKKRDDYQHESTSAFLHLTTRATAKRKIRAPGGEGEGEEEWARSIVATFFITNLYSDSRPRPRKERKKKIPKKKVKKKEKRKPNNPPLPSISLPTRRKSAPHGGGGGGGEEKKRARDVNNLPILPIKSSPLHAVPPLPPKRGEEGGRKSWEGKMKKKEKKNGSSRFFLLLHAGDGKKKRGKSWKGRKGGRQPSTIPSCHPLQDRRGRHRRRREEERNQGGKRGKGRRRRVPAATAGRLRGLLLLSAAQPTNGEGEEGRGVWRGEEGGRAAVCHRWAVHHLP